MPCHCVEQAIKFCRAWCVCLQTLGFLRVPLYTMPDKRRGLPIFLANQFSGNARMQLIGAIEKFNIMTKEELDLALQTAANILKGVK